MFGQIFCVTLYINDSLVLYNFDVNNLGIEINHFPVYFIIYTV